MHDYGTLAEKICFFLSFYFAKLETRAGGMVTAAQGLAYAGIRLFPFDSGIF